MRLFSKIQLAQARCPLPRLLVTVSLPHGLKKFSLTASVGRVSRGTWWLDVERSGCGTPFASPAPVLGRRSAQSHWTPAGPSLPSNAEEFPALCAASVPGARRWVGPPANPYARLGSSRAYLPVVWRALADQNSSPRYKHRENSPNEKVLRRFVP